MHLVETGHLVFVGFLLRLELRPVWKRVQLFGCKQRFGESSGISELSLAPCFTNCTRFRAFVKSSLYTEYVDGKISFWEVWMPAGCSFEQ